ncbi:MAG: hypothetical protein BWY76_03224 [bacterium ADurb.Bin429]|nr:MAG: hypothetical protein BWY76_03224 [bacterium ADurb.Bin429]
MRAPLPSASGVTIGDFSVFSRGYNTAVKPFACGMAAIRPVWVVAIGPHCIFEFMPEPEVRVMVSVVSTGAGGCVKMTSRSTSSLPATSAPRGFGVTASVAHHSRQVAGAVTPSESAMT